jgi:hypothetical protein
VKEALQAAAAGLKQRATEALRSAEGPTKKLAKDTGQAVGSAAQAAPARIKDRATEALQTAEGPTKKLAKDTEQAVGSAAGKAKGPALVGAAALATVGAGIALGSKVKLRRRKRVLGVAVPRRTAVGKAAKRVGGAVDSVSATGQQIGRWSDDIQYLRERIAGTHVRLERREREGRV